MHVVTKSIFRPEGQTIPHDGRMAIITSFATGYPTEFENQMGKLSIFKSLQNSP